MNNARILRVTNGLLLFCGYQLHWFNAKTRTYRLSLCGLLHFIIIALVYAVCFNQHFEQSSSILKLMRDVSPFLYNLIRLQLMIGLKIFLFSLYELRFVARAANALAQLVVLPIAPIQSRFHRGEAFAYFLLFSTIVIFFCFGLYIAIEMQFKLPPMDHIMIGSALFIPHFVLAGSLRYFNIGCWLLRGELRRLAAEFDDTLVERCEANTKIDVDIGLEIIVQSSVDGNELQEKTTHNTNMEISLSQLYKQLEDISIIQKNFSTTMSRQLLMLFGMNSNALLAGVYSRLYFEKTWYVMFDPRYQRVFWAANYGIFVLIFWDYYCWCLTQSEFGKVKTKFYDSTKEVLKRKSKFNKSTRPILKSIHRLLQTELKFKMLGDVAMNTYNFVLLQAMDCLCISIIVVYEYLKDQIVSLESRLDDGDN